MNKNKLIERIKKLLAMASNNPNMHEAEIAMQRANKLLREHDLTMSSIADVDNEVVSMGIIGEIKPWTKIVYGSVARLYDVKFFISHRNGTKMGVFIGNESNRCTVEIIVSQLVDIINTEGKGRGNAWRNGAAFGVQETCQRIIAENKANRAEVIPGTGLVPVDISNQRIKMANDFCSQHFNLSSGKASNLSANRDGVAFGRKLSVNARISGQRAIA